MKNLLYILGQLEEPDLRWLRRAGSLRKLQRGETMIWEGRYSPSLFIVLQGSLVVTVAAVGRVATLRRGEVVGEISFVDHALPSATVEAAEPSLVLEVSKEALYAKVADDTAFGMRWYRAVALFMADRMRSAQMARGLPALGLDAPDEQASGPPGAQMDAAVLAKSGFQRLLKLLTDEPA